jgi:hypothetical protein
MQCPLLIQQHTNAVVFVPLLVAVHIVCLTGDKVMLPATSDVHATSETEWCALVC